MRLIKTISGIFRYDVYCKPLLHTLIKIVYHGWNGIIVSCRMLNFTICS